ncbi:MAG: hypothetical protein ACU0BS_10305 [Hasllibacter sp.]
MIRVEGVDTAAGAYRVAIFDGDRTVRGLVPCQLIGGEGAAHQTAHEAIARDARPIAAALRTLRDGGTPKPPYDTLTLTGDR